MAAGDIININTGVANSETFQPASGVEIMVLKVMGSSDTYSYGFTDGSQATSTYHGTTTNTYDDSGLGHKFGITNSKYFFISTTSNSSGFSGVQIK